MSRVIKFRGLRTDGKGWAIGNYVFTQYNNSYKGIIGVQQEDSHQIYPVNIDGYTHEVIPETVGQLHNGLTRKAGKEVYVGDIIKYNLAEGLGEPKSYNHKCTVENVEICFYWYIDIEVIGNIHQEIEVTSD